MAASLLLLTLILLTCLLPSLAQTSSKFIKSIPRQKLVTEEVEVLKKIGLGLGKNDWDFNLDPCSGQGNWSSPVDQKRFKNSVTCKCGFIRYSACHVVRIALKAQNLSGQLPPQLYRLRHLRSLDLSRNILTGTVPREWACMRLVELSLMGNRLSGPFPIVLTNIITLQNLSIEGNQFSGAIPPELGNLIHLQKLTLSSNNFTGQLPIELAKLTNLTDMRISDNHLSGKIPEFISNWTQMKKLHIQGSSFEGPIPAGISKLTNLTDLRISDLSGGASDFPHLNQISLMRTLILRNCFLHGRIPGYIGDMRKLKHLDLSFNNLNGQLPKSFHKLDKVDFLYLTRNMLTGSVPQEILERNKNADFSYNNFKWDNSVPDDCFNGGSVNLVESYSSAVNKRNVRPCLINSFPCGDSSPSRYSLHINCGGKRTVMNNDITYEGDLATRGASLFYSKHKWALSSTGNFMDNDVDADDYIITNNSAISNVSWPYSQLYKTARSSPLSLTYYGLCLISGNYTVKLHFAEIIYTNDRSFSSLGKRIFDVYIQGKLVLKDFNIEDEAGGPGKPIVKNFNTVVEKNTLSIHFYWAGKGTQGIPDRGVYGPLISAISVEPNFKPPSSGNRKVFVGLVIGIVTSASCLILLVLGILWRKGCLGGQGSLNRDIRSFDGQIGSFSLRQIEAATMNFNIQNKIGEGGFGPVYKGLLPDGTIVAVKQLSSMSRQGSHEFVNEIGMISALQHPNLVKLYGCCIEDNQLLLVYEYMENNCLSRALFGQEESQRLKLNWRSRQKICLGVARALAYLHEESILRIVHRDIKTSNVLLDKDFNAKISDFGLAKLYDQHNTHINTQVVGTIGYMAPEYAMRGHLSTKADVYSFGVVALELVTGQSNTNYTPTEECYYLLDRAYVLQERGRLPELVDPKLRSKFPAEEAKMMLNVALLCTNASPKLRPTMSQVVSVLEGRTDVQDLMNAAGPSTNRGIKGLNYHFWQTLSRNDSMSMNRPGMNRSRSRRSRADVDERGHLLRRAHSLG